MTDLSMPMPALFALYALVALIGALMLLLFVWQVQVLRGKAIKNPSGPPDDWHDQRVLYGLALADVFLACPVAFVGVAFVFFAPKLGVALLALIAFWMIWINLALTATSLKFHKPKITPMWVILYPFGSLIGAAFLLWTVVSFDSIYGV